MVTESTESAQHTPSPAENGNAGSSSQANGALSEQREDGEQREQQVADRYDRLADRYHRRTTSLQKTIGATALALILLLAVVIIWSWQSASTRDFNLVLLQAVSLLCLTLLLYGLISTLGRLIDRH